VKRAEPIAAAPRPDDPACPDSSEADYERRLAEIAVKRRRISALENELTSVRVALARFEALCQASVGDVLADLRHVAEAIGRYQRQLREFRDDLVDSPPDVEDADFADDAAESGAAETDPREDLVPAAERPESGSEAAGELRRIYRALAKRCHPDFARDDDDRARRQERMLQINDAFRRCDLEALRALRHEVEADDPGFAGRPLAERLAWALAEIERLDGRLAALRAEWLDLRRSDVHRLWKRHEAGEPIFDDLRDDLEAQLATQADRLDAIIAAWRERSGERAAAPVI
jgi:hypothetical protein